jgi:hypothetical protein
MKWRDFSWETWGEGAASVIWGSQFLAIDPEVRVRFQALRHFFRSSGYN